jgi:hypothetical protein
VNAPSDARRTGRGLVAGLITGFVAVSAGQLVAGIARPQGSPVAAVGSMAIDFPPPAVKSFAISTFGSHDKLVLVSGVLVVLAVFAAMIGALAMRRLRYGLAGLAVFAVIGLVAALTRPNAELVDALPTLFGAAAGAFALSQLVRTANIATAAAGGPGRGARGGGGAPARPAWAAGAPPWGTRTRAAPRSRGAHLSWPGRRAHWPRWPHGGASWSPVPWQWSPVESAWSARAR